MILDVPEWWSRIETVLNTHVPETAKTLAPPASEREVKELEDFVGLGLPESFKRSLRVHNGQRDPTRCHSFCEEGIFLNTTEIAETWKTLSELDEGFRQQYPGWDSHEFGDWWNRNWIPFTQSDCGSLCINLDPRLGDRIGE